MTLSAAPRIWEEVRNINNKLDVTIFLTTQYLEEADALAHRVGIIDRGKLAAQGTPADLKRARGSDLIVVRLDGEVAAATAALRSISQVENVEAHGQELTVSVANGAGPDQHRSTGAEPARDKRSGADAANADSRRCVSPGYGSPGCKRDLANERN